MCVGERERERERSVCNSGAFWRPQEGVTTPGAGIIGGCELPDMGTEN